MTSIKKVAAATLWKQILGMDLLKFTRVVDEIHFP